MAEKGKFKKGKKPNAVQLRKNTGGKTNIDLA